MNPPAISNQLQRLMDRSIVTSRRNGNNIFYKIVDPHKPRVSNSCTCYIDLWMVSLRAFWGVINRYSLKQPRGNFDRSDYNMQDKLQKLRLPLEGHLDLTYRCNNHCRRCWLWLPANSREQKKELTFDEIKRIVDEARSMGCRKWSISGGEPMLRPDFPEIFDYVTRKAVSYSLNTNGTLITPEMATILERKGTKMVTLYGATKETYDHVTRHPKTMPVSCEPVSLLRFEFTPRYPGLSNNGLKSPDPYIVMVWDRDRYGTMR